MLNLTGARRTAGGFSLIELMVSMAIGLIVAAGAVTLIVAIDQSNTETIQSTRLTQELRALASVIADDVKRTRRVGDSIAMVGQGTAKTCPTSPVTPNQPCYKIATAALVSGMPTCLTYGYTGTPGTATVFNYRAVRIANGNVYMDQRTFDPNAVSAGTALPTLDTTQCPAVSGTSTAYKLNSDEVTITSLCFSSNLDTGTCYFDSATGACALNTTVPVGNEIDVCIAGQLTGGDTYTKTLKRAYVQPIYVRSSAI
jgi:prepilin-type N-terminal cleavage/methylation domain-containing protein